MANSNILGRHTLQSTASRTDHPGGCDGSARGLGRDSSRRLSDAGGRKHEFVGSGRTPAWTLGLGAGVRRGGSRHRRWAVGEEGDCLDGEAL